MNYQKVVCISFIIIIGFIFTFVCDVAETWLLNLVIRLSLISENISVSFWLFKVAFLFLIKTISEATIEFSVYNLSIFPVNNIIFTIDMIRNHIVPCWILCLSSLDSGFSMLFGLSNICTITVLTRYPIRCRLWLVCPFLFLLLNQVSVEHYKQF